MRYFLLSLILALCSFHTARAQDVYNLVLDNATSVVNNPLSNFMQTQIAQFKRTSLIYLKQKTLEETDTIPSCFLDTQAYYLSEFVTLFLNDVWRSKRLDEGKRKERIMMFTDASVSNPLFYDEDKETTLSFIKTAGEVTPFSLDTDWQKAYLAAKSQLKK